MSLTTTRPATIVVNESLVAEATAMRRRAESLRHEAAGVGNDLVAQSFRRRASELELEAWVLEVRAGVPEQQLHHVA